MDMQSESHPFRQFYRNITFDTLKERHDNFSFNKAIDTKQQIYDTMHFKGLLDNPTDPVMVVYKKQMEEGITDDPAVNKSKMYQNEAYLNMSENSTKYNDFVKRMGGGSAHQQMRGSEEMGISQYSEYSNQRQPNMLQHQKRNDSENHLRNGQPYLAKPKEDLQKEFASHFKNQNRDRGKQINHHDFLDSSFLPNKQSASRKNFFSKAGERQVIQGAPYGKNSTSQGKVDLGYDRLVQQRKNYFKLQMQSYEIPLNKEKAGVPKWLQQKLKAEGKPLQSRVFSMNKTNPNAMKKLDMSVKNIPEVTKKVNVKKVEQIVKNYEKRHIFVLVDGQDILADNLDFSYVEINDRLSKFVPDKVWKSHAAQRLTLNQKIGLSMPSQAMQEQSMLEILDEVSTKLGEQFESAWQIDGIRMKSPLDLPIATRIIIASKSETFKGVTGLEQFDTNQAHQSIRSLHGAATFVNHVHVPTVRVKPQPQTWVHMAQAKWCRQNNTTNIPSYSDGGPNDSETQNKIIEAIQEEQNRVYQQDLQLLHNIRDPGMEKEQEDSVEIEQLEEYPYKQIEEDLIKYICEKIVAMREQPFIDAVDNLRRAQELNNLQMIMEMQRNKAKWNQQQSQVGQGSQQTSQAKEISQLHKELFSQAQDTFTINGKDGDQFNQGKVTFKNNSNQEEGDEEVPRAQTNKSVKRKGTASNDDEDPNKAGRMLKTEEIRQICDDHQLTRQEVYNIRSQFAGMCLMSKEDEEKEQAELKQAQNLDSRANKTQGNKGFEIGGDHEGKGAGHGSRQADGIGLNFFKKNCSFLAGCLPEIVERILVAHGLDIESSNATITWKVYLDLYCIFEAGKMEKQQLIVFWRKFFDQGGRGTVQEEDYMVVLEALVRGNTLRKANETTKMFAKMFQKMMWTAGCLGESKEIKSDLLVKAFEREDIDIQLLCSALGRQQLDESFLNINVSDFPDGPLPPKQN